MSEITLIRGQHPEVKSKLAFTLARALLIKLFVDFFFHTFFKIIDFAALREEVPFIWNAFCA